MKTRLLRYVRWTAKTRVRLKIGSEGRLWVVNPLNPHWPTEVEVVTRHEDPAEVLKLQRKVYISEWVHRRRQRRIVKQLNKQLL